MSHVLSASHLSVITRSEDTELVRIASILERKVMVDGRCDLEEMFGRLLDQAARGDKVVPKTLDLIGHSTSPRGLLKLGNLVIDAAKPTVTSFFRELADQDVLGRLGIHAVRLLGCRTADTRHARWTICTLSDILGVEVYGTRDLVYAGLFDAHGFLHERRYLLDGASDLRRTIRDPRESLVDGTPYERVLDLEALPAAALGPEDRWPVRVATINEARALLRLVRRRDGAAMPGLLASPQCEVALPSTQAGSYYRLQILLDGEFVRAYPDGADRPGVLFPIDNTCELLDLVERLPVARF